MLQKNKFTALLLAFTLVLSISIFAQEKPAQTKESDKSKMNMHDMKGMMDKKADAASPSDSTIIRKGIIDLVSLDKNKDGKIFLCPMEPNVISDSKGECPICGMNLRENTLEDAKAKLVKRGFSVKESPMNKKTKSEDKKDQSSVKIWNKVCPVQGEEVDPEAPTTGFNGKIIGFCCPGCDKKFAKNPAKYMKNLSEDGSSFIGTK